MSIVETGPVTSGVDPHLDVHVAAALDANGGVLGVQTFPTTTARFDELHVCARSARCSGWGHRRLCRRAGPSTAGNGGGVGRGGSPEPSCLSAARQVRHRRRRREAARAALSGRAGRGEDRWHGGSGIAFSPAWGPVRQCTTRTHATSSRSLGGILWRRFGRRSHRPRHSDDHRATQPVELANPSAPRRAVRQLPTGHPAHTRICQPSSLQPAWRG
jgi:hypothetical protein